MLRESRGEYVYCRYSTVHTYRNINSLLLFVIPLISEKSECVFCFLYCIMMEPSSSSSFASKALYVIPGQVIALSSENGGTGETDQSGFLRGHGTYIESLVLQDPSTRYAQSADHKKVITMENDPDAMISDNEDDTSTTDNQTNNNPPSKSTEKSGNSRLVAANAGPVTRINKLLSVHPSHSLHYYSGQVGDLVIGRVTSISAVQNRWKVSLVGGVGGTGLGDELVHTHKKEAVLPLSGVNLPTGAQRMRTAQDALEMRSWLKEGDLISAEIQKVSYASSGNMSSAATNAAGVVGIIGGGSGSETIMLHSRSMRYGKLENGCCVHVPPGLIKRQKAHFVTMGGPSAAEAHMTDETLDTVQDGFDGRQVDILLGCNGVIWIQRALPAVATGLTGMGIEDDKTIPLAETWELVKKRHAQTHLLPGERRVVARVRNSIEALALVSCNITPENIEKVVNSSASFSVSDMLRPAVIIQITACTRRA